MRVLPTFDDIFAVMGAASVGDSAARVEIPDGARADDLATRFALALNVLLDDLAFRTAEGAEATRRLEAQAAATALRQSEERFRLLVESVKDYAILMLDPHGHIISWNKGAERIKGYRAEEIIGQHFSRFYPPEDIASGKPAMELKTAIAEGRFEDEGWRLRKDGTRFWAIVVITPLYDEDHGLRGFAKVTRDFTDRKRIEAALQLANRELESFSYSVAHDLRAPLRGLNGFARILLDRHGDKLDAEGRDCLIEIQENAVRMGALIDALLSLSRVSRSELKPERVDVTAIARAANAQLANASPDRTVDVIVEEGLAALGDPHLVRALLDNLLGNAWKFTAKTAAPRIEVGSTETEGSRALFVKDNGAGFDMAYANKLFAPFQRLHDSSEFPGTGIGLATVQRIVQRHGGRIWAEGAEGRGATFVFTLNPDLTMEAPEP